jgi:hypothetical protein
MLILCFTSSAYAASKGACAQYARRAIEQYQQTTKDRKCRIKGDARWQPNYQNHYNWCLTAPTAWLRSEEKARDDHLYGCGAQGRFD